MSLQRLSPALLLWAWLAVGARGCGRCVKTGKDSMICPGVSDEEAQYTVGLIPNRALQLICSHSVKNLDYSLMNGCLFNLVTHIEFQGCPLPDISYGEILQKIGVNPGNVTFLITSQLGKRNMLAQWHLDGLDGLQMIKITGIDSVPDGLFRDKSNLEVIELSNSTFTHLPVGIFDNMTSLHTVKLQDNYLEDLRPGLFSGAPGLEIIHLHNNHVTNIPENLFRDLKSLKNLSLRENKLERLLRAIFTDNSEMEFLDVSNNMLIEIEAKTFINMKKLKILKLSHNRLKTLPNGAFQECHSLERLELSNNQLTNSGIDGSFPPGFKSSLTYIDLGHNSIASSDVNDYFALNNQHKLKHVFLNNNNISVMYDAFRNVFLDLETLDLSRNAFEYLDFFSLVFISKSVKLNLKYNKIKNMYFQRSFHLSKNKVLFLSMEGNPLECNCYMYGFARIVQGKSFPMVNNTMKITIEDIDNVSCQTSYGERENLLDVQTEALTCPQGIKKDNCSHAWRQHDRMLIIDCSYQSLKDIPQIDLAANSKVSFTINLANNSLTSLASLQQPIFAHLHNLTVPYNKLSSLNVSHLPAYLRVLDVRGNNLTTLPAPTLNFLNATDMNLMLGDNPWHCDCDLLDLLSFLHVPSRKVGDFEALQCWEGGQPLMSVSEHELCPFFLQPMVIVTIVAILIFLILFAVLGTVSFYKYKQGIKVWLFAHRMCLWAITEDELDADKKYDAFISYSHKDEEFVTKVLVPELESGEPKYRVCLHYRDWVPGEYIQNQILQSVEASRRTIVVLSSNFIESVWGQLEFRAAHSQALQDRTNRIIVIVYGKIPDENDLDEKLQLYISTKTYVRWGDKKFWEKLRYIMPHPQELVQMKHRKRKDTDKLELCKSTSKQSVC